MKKIIIVAIARNNVIGKDGKIPWHSSEDLKHFKKTTMGNPIIMGRKTFESLGKPLKGRLNIVITQNQQLGEEFPELKVFDKLSKAYKYCETEKFEKVYIVGGGKIYSEALKDADYLIVTYMHLNVLGDTYFPEIDFNHWELIKKESFDNFEICEYNRN